MKTLIQSNETTRVDEESSVKAILKDCDIFGSIDGDNWMKLNESILDFVNIGVVYDIYTGEIITERIKERVVCINTDAIKYIKFK